MPYSAVDWMDVQHVDSILEFTTISVVNSSYGGIFCICAI